MTAWRDHSGAAVCMNYAAHADAADRLAAEIVADGGRAISAMADVAEFLCRRGNGRPDREGIGRCDDPGQ